MFIKLTLYKYSVKDPKNLKDWPERLKGYDLVIQKPTLFSLRKYEGNAMVNLLWYVFSFGRFRILYLLDQKKIVHFSYITPKIFRFPFMSKQDIQIGPCETNLDYQRQGIFTAVLKTIAQFYSNKDCSVWTYTTVTNQASQKAFERSGFVFYSFAEMNKYFKILTLVNPSKK